MSDTPQPPAGGDGVPDRTPHSTPVVIPSWVSADWMYALRVAMLGHLLLLLGGAAVTLVAILQRIAGVGLSGIPWGAAALNPILMVLGWAGGGRGEPILLTGAVYLFVAYLVVCRRTSLTATIVRDRVRAFAAAVKIAVLAAGVLLVVAILVNIFATDATARAFVPFVGARVDLTSLVFTSVFVGSIAATFALIVSGGTTLFRLLGLDIEVPRPVRAGIEGGRRTLLVGGLGLLALSTIGSLLDALTGAGTTVGRALAALLGSINGVLIAGIDEALLLLLGTTKFLHEGGFVWASPGGVVGWRWLSIPVLAGAYLAGGVVAARAARPDSQARASKAALLVGPTVAACCLLFAFGWTGQGFIDDIVPLSILLPTLWGAVAVLGAWIWANQQGLPGGLVVERVDQPDDQAPDPPVDRPVEQPLDPAPDQPPANAPASSATRPLPVEARTEPLEPPEPMTEPIPRPAPDAEQAPQEWVPHISQPRTSPFQPNEEDLRSFPPPDPDAGRR